MVARSMVEIATALQDVVDLGMGAEEKLRRLAEAVAEEMKKQTDETEKKIEEIQTEMQQLRKQSNKGGDETKKDRTRSEPKDAFNGKN